LRVRKGPHQIKLGRGNRRGKKRRVILGMVGSISSRGKEGGKDPSVGFLLGGGHVTKNVEEKEKREKIHFINLLEGGRGGGIFMFFDTFAEQFQGGVARRGKEGGRGRKAELILA